MYHGEIDLPDAPTGQSWTGVASATGQLRHQTNCPGMVKLELATSHSLLRASTSSVEAWVLSLKRSFEAYWQLLLLVTVLLSK